MIMRSGLDYFTRLIRVLATLILADGCLTALDPAHAISQYGHTAWTRSDGQLPGRVRSMAQTLDGALWIGTEFGLLRFDGITFVPWIPPAKQHLASQSITALAAARDGGLWIGTRKGLFYWKEQVVEQIRFKPGSEASVKTILVDHAGATWIGTVGFHSGALCRVDAARSECVPADGFRGEGVFSLFEDRDGKVWAGSTDGLYVSGGNVVRRSVAYRALTGIVGIAQVDDGIVWTDGNGGLRRLVNGEPAAYRAGLSNTMRARALFSDRAGSLWIGTAAGGILHVHQGRTDRFARPDGLSGDSIQNFFEDHEENVWVATERGLDRFRDLPVVTFSKREGLSEDSADSVYAAKNGGVWTGTANGLNLIHNGNVRVFDKHAGLLSNGVSFLFEDTAGTLWVDSMSGLAAGGIGGFHQLDLLRGQVIRSLAAAVQDSAGDLWLSDFEHGLIRIRAGEVREILPWSLFGNKKGFALEADSSNGEVLIGFHEGGIAVYHAGRPIRWYTAADGLGQGFVTDIHAFPDGTIWIATEGGLSRLRYGKISTLSSKNGLPCDVIRAIVEDDEGRLWLNTSCGLVRLDRRELDAWSENFRAGLKAHVYAANDGMPAATSLGYFRRAARSSDGRLWFPIFDGVAVVDPRHIPENRVPPPVVIDRLIANGKSYPAQKELRLPPGARNLEIDYTAFSFVDPSRVQFRYKLEGSDAQWNDVKGRRQAFFSNLTPKRYRFRVIASNNNGLWNETGATLNFSVAPMFYQTYWFLASCIAALCALLWLFYQLRVRQIEAKIKSLFEERFKERTRIARELHDTLVQKIAAIALELNGLSKSVIEPSSAKDWLHKLRKQTEGLLHEVRQAVSDMRDQLAGDEDLVAEIWKLAEEAIEDRQIDFRVGGAETQCTIPSRLADPVLRIVQEAVRNAVLHASPTEIIVHVSRMDGRKIRVKVEDNGCGFDWESGLRKPNHWGLTNMRERAESIGADFEVSTAPGHGTKIEITFRTD